jgi:hypothetical protein
MNLLNFYLHLLLFQLILMINYQNCMPLLDQFKHDNTFANSSTDTNSAHRKLLKVFFFNLKFE